VGQLLFAPCRAYSTLHLFTVGKAQNPLHQFPRSKSVTSWRLPRLREVTGKLV